LLCNAGVGTQDLAHAGQALPLSCIPSWPSVTFKVSSNFVVFMNLGFSFCNLIFFVYKIGLEIMNSLGIISLKLINDVLWSKAYETGQNNLQTWNRLAGRGGD
jgi:hypothetical protein